MTGSQSPAIRPGPAQHLGRGELTSALDDGQGVPGDARYHLDHCHECWAVWNELRWERAQRHPLFHLLVHFLGYDPRQVDASWQLASEWSSKLRTSFEDDIDFYQNTPWYVQNLFLWNASGQRPRYVDFASVALKNASCRTVLDFGSGIGNDSLELAQAGFDVYAFEVNTACNAFHRLCIAELGFSHRISVVPSLESLSGLDYDCLWAMDVIEHLRDPIAVLGPLTSKATVFVYDTEHSGPSGGRHPFHFEHNVSAFRKYLRDVGLHRATHWPQINFWIRGRKRRVAVRPG